MNDPIDPVRPLLVERRAGERRSGERRNAEAPAQAEAGSTLPVPVATPPAPPASGRADGASAFAAQLLGQTGRKRGLRAGPPALEEARSAYLEAEFSGTSDRRLPVGVKRKTDI